MKPGGALRAGALLALAVAPFLVALAASPPEVPDGPGGAEEIPATPGGGRPTDLSEGLHTLPLLIDGLPDPASRAALGAYRRAGILDGRAVQAAFEAAVAAFAVGDDLQPALADAAAGLLDPEIGVAALDGALRRALAADDTNRDRLVNAASMLFGYAALLDAGIVQTPETSPFGYPFHGPQVEATAAGLLDLAGELFGPTPVQLVNRAFIESLTNYRPASADTIDPLLDQALELGGDDPAVRLAAADLQARRPDDARSWEAALRTVEPLLDAPETRVLGLVGQGDVYLAAASLRAYEAPRTARVLARRAIAAYDTVLADHLDPGLLAGRARALALLGELDPALATVEQAVDLAPDAVDLRLAAAGIAEAAGDIEAMAEHADRAATLTEDGWNPRMGAVRFVPGRTPSLGGFAHHGDLGMFGASVGSTRDHVALIRTPQGGGIVADIDVVPRVIDPARDLWRRSGFAPDVATATAVQAAVALGDADRAFDRLDTWSSQPVITSQDLLDETLRAFQSLAWAVDLVETGAVPGPALDEFSGDGVVGSAEATLRRTGRLAELEELCATLVESAPEGLDLANLHRCLGDARYLQGDRDGAVAAYTGAIDGSDGFVPERLRIQRAAVVLQDDPGDPGARSDLEQAAVRGEDGDAGTALVILATDHLRAGDVGVARAHYGLALALLDPRFADSDDQAGRAGVRQARAQALINRGIASLRLAQDDPQRPPRCDSPDAEALCDGAAADIDAALAVDPLNPIALMDLGWVARSRGDTAMALDALRQATTADPSLFPAFNDLGVLAAGAGDEAAAREAFRAALGANRSYALGWWNLGVLELEGGLAGLPAGQAALARAVELDPTLAGQRADYRTDEAVYEATFGGLREVSSGWPVSRTYGLGAAVLGGVGLVTALGKLTRSGLGNAWTTGAEMLVDPEKGPRWRRRAIARLRLARSRLPERLAPWAPWLGVALVLAAVTVVTVWRREPVAVLAALASVALATASAMVVHEVAHVVALRRYGGRLVPAQWGPGAALAVLLLPLQASSGPYLGERVEAAPDERLVRIHAAGPVANIGLAGVAFATYLLRPAPILFLLAQVSLAVAAYTLLPNRPLDGKVLAEQRPGLAAGLAVLVASAGTAFAVGLAG